MNLWVNNIYVLSFLVNSSPKSEVTQMSMIEHSKGFC